jgi:hypothetical protein
MRGRIRQRFAELHEERTQAEASLAELTASQPRAYDTAILGKIPCAGDILPGLPPALKARLLAIFDVGILGNKTGNQVTSPPPSPTKPSPPCPNSSTPAKTATTTPVGPHPCVT